jgi:STE24 endopeptidase
VSPMRAVRAVVVLATLLASLPCLAQPVAVPEPSQQALDYHASGNVLFFVDLAWGLLVPALFLFTGLSARIRDWATRIGRKWFLVVGVYFAIFLVLNFVVGLPLAYYEEYVRQHAYGLSNQTFGKWLGDSLKGLAVGLVVGFLLLWIPFLVLKKSPKRWWLYVGLLSIPFTILALLVSPVWVEPLFNDFGPMKDKALEAKILSLAERAGIEGGRVYEVNKSVDTTELNAYVTGFGGTKRIVLWDTTIARLDGPELLFVMAHEMGHYVLGHLWRSIVALCLMSLFTLWLAHRTAGSLIRRFKHRFGFEELADVAALPLIVLLLNVFGFASVPAANAYSRHIEHEADRFGLEITRDSHAAATAFVKLQVQNLAVPRPGMLWQLWRASHPVLGERVDFANDYKPWEKGEPLVYGKYFQGAKESP